MYDQGEGLAHQILLLMGAVILLPDLLEFPPIVGSDFIRFCGVNCEQIFGKCAVSLLVAKPNCQCIDPGSWI